MYIKNALSLINQVLLGVFCIPHFGGCTCGAYCNLLSFDFFSTIRYNVFIFAYVIDISVPFFDGVLEGVFVGAGSGCTSVHGAGGISDSVMLFCAEATLRNISSTSSVLTRGTFCSMRESNGV